jgi:hypothetical protein
MMLMPSLPGKTFLSFTVRLMVILCGGAVAAAEPSAEQLAFFEAKVRPLLVKHCYECHAAKSSQTKGGLALDSRSGWQAGGDSGEVIVPGRPDESLLIESVRYSNSDLQMPPKYRLSDQEIAVLVAWVELGAPDPRSSGPIAKKSGVDWSQGDKHWAFQPIAAPTPPQVQQVDWIRDPLDRFILEKIEAANLKPVPDADRFALIRRVTLDLTGLPPAVSEVAAFIHDPASDDQALAKVVDRLLDSPAFGERWGRHWLDVARYADSVGKTRNVPFPYAWRYRNYVIDAFQADKPYDQFLMEQLAGDLLPAADSKDREENLVATGFLALGSMDLNERDQDQFMLDRIDDQMDTVGRATLGLTLGCARCHDHKFDPIAQTDYYALGGIFASTQTLSGQQNRRGGNKEYFQPSLLVRLDAGSAKGRASTEDLRSKNATQIARLKARIQQLQASGKKSKLGSKQRSEVKKELTYLRKQLSELSDSVEASAKGKKNRMAAESFDYSAPLAMAVVEGESADLALRVRGEPDLKGETVPRAFPKIFQHVTSPALSASSSGRLQLAQWLTARDHPLTSRVIVNRLWSHLMGRGLVATVDNFGVSGSPPTHPELLDHLASRFMDQGWSVKKLIRALVLSRTYRLSGQHLAANAAVDESNSLYWRFNLRRLEAEAIRDSLLAAGGMLQHGRPDGAALEVPVNADLSKGNPQRGGRGGDVIEYPVRSVYLPVFRSRLPGMFTIFDFAEPDQVNGQRDVTTVAPQALFMLNNPFVVAVSQRAAERILQQKMPDETTRIRYAYAYALCRYPSAAEVERASAFLQAGSDPQESWGALLQALYSSAEFRYVP